MQNASGVKQGLNAPMKISTGNDCTGGNATDDEKMPVQHFQLKRDEEQGTLGQGEGLLLRNLINIAFVLFLIRYAKINKNQTGTTKKHLSHPSNPCLVKKQTQG